MEQRDVTTTRPIGYWLKHVDQVITEHVDAVLDEHGFTRIRWQILNLAFETGTIARKDMSTTMKTFIDQPQFDAIIAGLVAEGWLVERGDGEVAELTITEAGRRERDTIFSRQRDVRRRAVEGISDEEYLLVLHVLQRIARNLETSR